MQRYLRNIDWWLVGAVCALVGIGLMLIASATHSYAVARGEAWFVERQGIFFGINVLLVIFCLRFDYRLLQQIAKPLYIFNLVLLLAVMFVGHSALGAQRWIQIGPVTIQPSEFAKAIIIICLAAFLAKNPDFVPAKLAFRGAVNGTKTFFPQTDGTDGFFVAKFIRNKE